MLRPWPIQEAKCCFLPYLEGERSPIWDARASGALVGLRSAHGEGDVTRAILEGVHSACVKTWRVSNDMCRLRQQHWLRPAEPRPYRRGTRLGRCPNKSVATLRIPMPGCREPRYWPRLPLGFTPTSRPRQQPWPRRQACSLRKPGIGGAPIENRDRHL